MSRPLHPVNEIIYEIITELDNKSLPVTTRRVRIKAAKVVTQAFIDGYIPAGILIGDAVNRRVGPCLRSYGFIRDADTGERIPHEFCTITDLTEQLRVKESGSEKDVDRIAVLRAEIGFLRSQIRIHGKGITVGDFADEIEEIYEEHGFQAW
jgi:hypothetical protein